MNALVGKHLQAAESIGRLLVRDALWADDQCFWLTQSEIAEKSSFAVTACSRDLAHGASGTGLFLARLFALNDDPLAANVVAGVSRLLISELERTPANDTLPRQSGDREVATALLEMTTLARLPLVKQSAMQCIDRLALSTNSHDDSLSAAWSDRSDSLCARLRQILAGKAGKDEQQSPVELAQEAIEHSESAPEWFACFADPLLADAFLLAAKLCGDSIWLDAARSIADHVLMRTEQYGQPWRGAVGREYPPIGLTDGLAGIGHFMLRLSSPDVPSLIERQTDLS